MESADWMLELEAVKFSVRSIVEDYPKGSFQRETAINAAKGIQWRIDWILEQAKLETKREIRR